MTRGNHESLKRSTTNMTVPIVQDDFITKFLNRRLRAKLIYRQPTWMGNARTAVPKIVPVMPGQKFRSGSIVGNRLTTKMTGTGQPFFEDTSSEKLRRPFRSTGPVQIRIATVYFVFHRSMSSGRSKRSPFVRMFSLDSEDPTGCNKQFRPGYSIAATVTTGDTKMFSACPTATTSISAFLSTDR